LFPSAFQLSSLKLYLHRGNIIIEIRKWGRSARVQVIDVKIYL